VIESVTFETIAVEINDAIGHIVLNRPEVHNAFNGQMVSELTGAFHSLSDDDSVRVVVLSAAGQSFCAGADLNEMRAVSGKSREENLEDAEAIYDLMVAASSCSKPVIARVEGAAIGGGAGLVSCCDIVVASETASIGFGEVRLGIVPAVISPFVMAKIGISAGRRFLLTGQRLSADDAVNSGLFHVVVPASEVDDAVSTQLRLLFRGAPGAQAELKQILFELTLQGAVGNREQLATILADRRETAEGVEGISSFLEKRSPGWLA